MKKEADSTGEVMHDYIGCCYRLAGNNNNLLNQKLFENLQNKQKHNCHG